MATLNWWNKDGKRETYNLHKAITTIGAVPQNDIFINNMGLENYHMQIIFDGRDFVVKTVLPDNIFLINGKKKKKTRLVHRDCITCGDIEFIFDQLGEHFPASSSKISSDIKSLKRLQQFSLDLFMLESVNEILEKLMDQVIDLTGAAKGFLILFENKTPIIKVARNIRRENLGGAVSQLSDSIVAQVVAEKKPIIVSDAQNNKQFSNAESIISLNLNSVMCVPLMQKQNLLGIIYLGNDTVRGFFEADTLETLNVFASQASLIVQNAILLNELKLQNEELSNELKRDKFGEIIGASAAMSSVFSNIEKVAPTEVSVLISGETGTGKELIAREIHNRSSRKNGPFVTINCGAIPENLMESEFFGHVRGAFTGAEQTTIGKFQAANRGTLFLDEIGEMPLGLQVKILRTLQERQVVKVGSTKVEDVDIRVVSATNKNLEDEVKNGTFREDLLYRLNVISINLPPLRQRGDDVILLAKYLLRRYSKEFGFSVSGFTDDAFNAMLHHSWPGNVREMENKIKKGIILTNNTLISATDLDLENKSDVVYSLAVAKENFQKQYILDALKRNNGNRAKTARELDVDPRTIYRYLEKV